MASDSLDEESQELEKVFLLTVTSLHFSPQAIASAKALALQDPLWQRPQVQGITIDGLDSRDLDDAVWIEPIETGAILFVHIADVAELVEIGSILDRVAIARTPLLS